MKKLILLLGLFIALLFTGCVDRAIRKERAKEVVSQNEMAKYIRKFPPVDDYVVIPFTYGYSDYTIFKEDTVIKLYQDIWKIKLISPIFITLDTHGPFAFILFAKIQKSNYNDSIMQALGQEKKQNELLKSEILLLKKNQKILLYRQGIIIEQNDEINQKLDDLLGAPY